MAQNTVNEAIQALKAGEKAEARGMLMAILNDEPQNEDAWLVLSAAVDEPERKRQCLETVLEINPDNEVARRGLGRLQPPAEQIEEAAAEAPAPPDAVVAAATDPQPAEPAPAEPVTFADEEEEVDDAGAVPTFEQKTPEREAEAPMEAAATAPAPPDAIAEAETPPPDAEDDAADIARSSSRRMVTLFAAIVAVLLILMIVIWVILLSMS